MTSASPGTVLLVGVFAWSIYRRIRRNIGRQKLRPGRIIFSLVMLCVASLIILTANLQLPALSLAFSGGLVLGAGISFFGLRYTRFETTEEGHFYTPNLYIGVALSTLLLGRMVYRMMSLENQSYQAGHPQAFQSPLTLFILGLTVGYYLAYYIGLFVHTHDKKPAGPVS